MTTDRWLVHRRLAEDTDQRLPLIAAAPKRILLFGADGDSSRRLLAARYPQAEFSEYDSRAGHLSEAAAARRRSFWQRLAGKGKTVPQHCQAPSTPLPEAQADWLWCNLGLVSSAAQPVPVIENWARALKTDGLLFLTHFGLDTLAEIIGYLKARNIPVASPFADMHDLGDMLFHHGFYDPVIDTAKLQLAYTRADTFWQDMDTLGIWAALQFADEAAARAAVSQGFAQGLLHTVTLETVYGHAVRKLQLPENESPVQFYPRRK
ncbi:MULTISPECIES: methyltransferase [Eikenella]|uniref:Methyltransferase n=1 Tax=Eikenella longinqua TaxID=1795827 RepID=A0A1A9RW67_9NEIS|nr:MULTISPECIES: methyltransferase [Eikenella]OAM26693.1 methyltransferase [Eikenella longinqua]